MEEKVAPCPLYSIFLRLPLAFKWNTAQLCHLSSRACFLGLAHVSIVSLGTLLSGVKCEDQEETEMDLLSDPQSNR